MTADGKTITEVANTIHYSNGLTLARDQQHLLVAEMLAGRVLSFPIEADGKLGSRTVWARLEDLAPPTPNEDAYNGPDGVKLGPDGNYYIAQNGSGRRTGSERGKAPCAHDRCADAVCHEYGVWTGRSKYRVCDWRFRAMEGAVSWCGLSVVTLTDPGRDRC